MDTVWKTREDEVNMTMSVVIGDANAQVEQEKRWRKRSGRKTHRLKKSESVDHVKLSFCAANASIDDILRFSLRLLILIDLTSWTNCARRQHVDR